MLGISISLTAIALIPLIWIISYVIIEGGKYINIDFFTQLPVVLGQTGGGVLHAIQGTLILTVIAAFFSIPPGILAALYVTHYPKSTLGVAIRFGTDVLSGIPSIVIGIFCYALIVKPQGHYSALAGGIALSILMLPIIIRTTEEMLKLVPSTLREASLGLGAPEWKTSIRVILPAASTGIITGILLGLARASGETAPLLFTALGNERFNITQIIQSGVAQGQNLPTILGRIINSPVDSLPLTLYKYTSLPYPERAGQAWGVALVLIGIVFIINITVRTVIAVRTRKLRG